MAWDSEIEKDTAQVSYAVELCQELYKVDANTTFQAIVRGDPAMIQKLALGLLAAPRQSKGNALMNYLCVEMLARCCDQQRSPDPELVQLLRTHLSTDTFAARNRKKPLAFKRAVQYFGVYPNASLREIADYAGTDHNTVAQWKNSGELRRSADDFKRLVTGLNPETAAEWKTRYDESLRRVVTEHLSGKKGLP